LTQGAADYVSADAGGAEAARVYNSNPAASPAQTTIPMGARWRNSYDLSLQVLSATQVRLHRASGRTIDFSLSGGVWAAQVPAGALTQNAGAWQYVSPGNAVEQYGTNGRLQSISRAGTPQTMQYDGAGRLVAVLTPSGRNISYLYNAAGRVSQVNLPGGLYIGYTYDGNGNLASVRRPDGAIRWYHYEQAATPNALTGITDETGRRTHVWNHDSANRPVYARRGSGTNPVSIAYSGNSATTTDARNTVRTWNFVTTANGQPDLASQTTHATVDSATLTSTRYFDTNGNLRWAQSPTGEWTDRLADSRDRATYIARGAGTAQQVLQQNTWHPTFNQATSVSVLGVTHTNTVDAHGRVTQITRTGKNGTSTVVMQRSFNAQNLLHTLTDARGVTTTFNYNASGDLTSTSNTRGFQTWYSQYDAHGRAGRIDRSDGTVITRSFDALGRMQWRNVNGRQTTFAYDNAGRLTRTTKADGTWRQRNYNAAGLLASITNQNGESTVFNRDATGAVTGASSYSASGQLVSQKLAQYDALGRARMHIDGVGNQTQTTFATDGRLRSVIDAVGAERFQQWDILNRPTVTTVPNTASQIAAGGPSTVQVLNTYDAASGINQSTRDTRLVTTGYSADPFNKPISEWSPDSGGRSVGRNALGDVLSSTDARGITLHVSRDNLGRITNVTPGYGAPVSISYVAGRQDHLPASMSDPSGNTTWTYDSAGRMMSKAQTVAGITRQVSLLRDGIGRVTRMTYPSGMAVDLTYSADKVASLTVNGMPFISGIAYQATTGVATQWNWANSSQYQRTLDAAGRITSVRLGPVLRQYSHDALNRVTGIADTQGGLTTTQGFAYDEAGHLVGHSRGSGAGYSTTGYTYDSNGNRTFASTTTANGNTYPASSITYVPGTNRMAQDSTGRSYTYGADGNTTSDSWSDYSYDAYGRLTNIVGGTFGVPHWQQRGFNGQGMRVSSFMQYWVDTSGTGGGGEYSRVADADSKMPATPRDANLGSVARTAAAGAAPSPTSPSANGAAPLAGALTGPNAATQAAVAARLAIAASLRTGPASGRVSPNPAASRATNSAAWSNARASVAADLKAEASTSATSPAGRGRLAPQTRSAALTSSGYWAPAQYMQYVHDDEGRLLGEYGTNGQYGAAYSQETIWFQGMPVGAMINGVLYNISADHLGTPRSITRRSDNAEVWRWSGNAFGTDEPTGPGGNGLPLVTYNLRFAGQQFEAMTGHHYNWMRDYQPWTGRYIQSDPIGLAGGVSRYAYVAGNPVSYIDPDGLSPLAGARIGAGLGGAVGGPIGAGIGGLVGAGIGWYVTGPMLQGATAPKPPDIPSGWKGDTPPAPGWKWRGPDAPGGPRGGWVSPDGRESVHHDPNHGPPIGPHTDWNDPNGGRWRIFPDGTCRPK